VLIGSLDVLFFRTGVNLLVTYLATISVTTYNDSHPKP